jgi:nicotinate-nucleotide pyrophosphorylase (carboxylating)
MLGERITEDVVNEPMRFSPREAEDLRSLVERALAEDIGPGDLTSSALVPAEEEASASLVAKAEGVLAGTEAVEAVFAAVDPGVRVVWALPEGARVRAGTALGRIQGKARSVLAGERTALNFLQRLSGVASLTRRFVDAVEGTSAAILDTRKTLPAFRALDKYAVRVGGGTNHRLGLHDEVLIKENHLASGNCSPGEGVRRARASSPPGTFVTVEVETLDQFRDALAASPDAVMLDDMTDDDVREAVRLRGPAGKPLLEISGGITLDNVRQAAGLGVDRISVGALTHSPKALDISLKFEA